MHLFAREIRWRQSRHLSLLQDAHSSALSQALRNMGWLTQVTRRLTNDVSDRRYLESGGVPQVERVVAALRFAFGSGLVRTLEDRQQVLDHVVFVLDEVIWGAPAVGLHYQDLETSLSDPMDALEALIPF
ncbi:hypothetical protein LIER_11577 [Lithospermum erythrorhizon]|uniref:Uncharacterized protein n=1 Tax=Lithospermum erythrorhizon TaxID=34254 RepID=A0AAV3PNJ7_LITER